MGFSCKQTHLILFYFEIGSGWPQNKDQPQRMDISHEANQKKRKEKENPSSARPAQSQLAGIGRVFPFPPALLFSPAFRTAFPAPLLSPAATATKTPPRPRVEEALCDLRLSQVEVQYNHHPSRSQCAGVAFSF